MSLDKTLLGIAKSAVDTQQKSRDGRNVVSKGVDAVTNKSYANEDKKVAAAALRKWENSTWKPKVEAKLKQELKTRAPHLKPGSKAYQQTYDSLFNKNYKDLQSAKAKAQQQIGTLRQKGQTQRQVDNEYSQKEAARNNNTKLQAASSAARDTGEAVSGALATGSSRALRYPLQLAADIGENDDGGIFDRGAKALERHEDNLQQVYPAYADIQQNGNFGQKLALSAVEQIPNLALSFTGAGAAAKGAQLAGAGAKMTAATAYGTAAATMYPQAYGDGNDSTKQELENATPEQLRVAVRSKDIYKDHFDKNIKAGMSEDEAHQKSRDQTISSIAEESGDAVGLATLALSMIAPGVGSFTANQAAGGAVSKFGQKVFNKLAAKADAGKVAKYAIPTAVGTGIVGLNVAEEALQEGYTDYKAQQAAVDVGVKDKINQPQLKEAMLMGGILGGAMGGGTYVGTRNSKFQQAQDGLREAQDTYAQAASIIPQLQQQIEEVSPRSAEGQALTAQLEETKAALSTMAAEAETRGIPKTSLARRAPRIDPTNSFDTDFDGGIDGATELSEQDFENALNPDGTPAPQVTPAAPVMSEQELDIQDAQLAEFIAEQHALDEAIEDGSNDKSVEQSLAEAQNWYDSKRGEGKQGLSGVVSRAAATEQDAAFAQQQEGIKGATASINDYIASERAKQQQIDAQLQQEAEAATTDEEKQAVAQKIEQRDAERAKEDDILEAREQLAQPYENELFDTTIIGADGAPFKLARFWDSSLPAGAKAKAIADAFGGQVDQNVAKSDWSNLPEGVQKELHKWFTERLNGVRQSREGAVAQASEQVAELAVEQPQAVAPTASGLTMPVRAEQAPVEAEQGAASYTLDNLKDDINNNYGSDPQAMFDAQKRAEEAGLPQPEINRVIQETISEKVGWTKPAATQLTDENPVINIPAPTQAKAETPAPTTDEGIYKSKPAAKAAIKKQKLDPDSVTINQVKGGGFEIVPNAPEKPSYAQAQEQAATELGMTINEDGEYGGTDAEFEVFANRVDEIQGRSLSNSTPTPQQNTTAPTNDAAIGKDGQAKWFGSNDKAQAFIAKKGLSGTHEVVSAGKSRFEIQPKAEGTPQADIAKAETVLESGKSSGQSVRDIATSYASKDERLALLGEKEIHVRNAAKAAGRLIQSNSDWYKKAFDDASKRGSLIDGMSYGNRKSDSVSAYSIAAGEVDGAIRFVMNDDINARRERDEANQAGNKAISDSIQSQKQKSDEKKEKYKSDEASVLDTFGMSLNDIYELVKSPAKKLFAKAKRTKSQDDQKAADKANRKARQDIFDVEYAVIAYANNDMTLRDFLDSKAGQYPALVNAVNDDRFAQVEAYNQSQKPKNITDEQFAELTSSRNTPSTSTGEQSEPAKRAAAKKAATEKTQNDVSEQEAKSRFADNKLFTEDKVAAARALLKSKMGQLNSGFDPEMAIAGMTLAGAYIESGVRKFGDYAKLMVEDFGDNIKPQLLSFWEGARNWDGLDTEGMTSVADSKREYDQLKAESEKASTPAKPLTLNQDWGVQKIDAYNVKTEFLKDAENYLNDVKDILKQKGYTSTVNNSGKPIKVVDTNQFGMQSSGAVQLTMQKDGVFVGVFIGNNDQTQNNSNHKQGIEIKVQSTPHEIWRLAQEFEWVDAKTTSQDLAKIIESHVAEKRKDKGANKSSTPAKSDAPKKVGSGTQAKTLIGENNEGLPLYEDDRGVRSILEHGIIYVNESVNITPTGIEQNPREQRYLTKEELAQESNNDTGTSNQDDRQRADGELSTADQADAESRNTGRAEAEPTSDVPNVDGRSNRSDPNDGDEAGQSAGKNKRAASTDSRSGTGSAQSNDGANAKSNKSAVKATDYAIPSRDENAKQPSWFEIGERNVEIIELVQQLESDGRHATPDEQALLADYKGWGSSKIEIFPHPTKGYSSPRWEALGEKLKSLLTDSEYATARRTTQYAHYTPPSIVNGIYAALEQFGFKGGQVFEPASGIGVFNGLMPRDMASKSHYVGVELDPMTALIAKHLYPLSDMTMGDYTKVKLPDNHFDVAVGNPPFADISYSYGAGKNKKPYLIHDYFFAKTLDKLKPGGVMAFVTSKGSMDKTNSGARESFAEQADLIGAIRLPNTAFKDEAGTAVVTDIIFLRKRMPDEASNGVKWTDTQEKTIDGEKVSINEYFVDNPNMVLGRNAITSGQFGPTYTVESDSNNLSGQIETAIAQLPKDIFKPARGSNAEAAKVAEIDYGVKSSQQREGGVYVKDGKLMKVIDGVGKPLTHRYGTNGKRIALTDPQIQFLTDYTGVRDAFKQSQQDQLNDNPNWQDSLDNLNTAYDSFVKKHGRLMAHTISTTERADGKEITTTRFANKAILFLDVDGYVASALENIVDGEVIGKDAVIEKGSYFKGRTLNKPKTPTIKTTQDALVYVLNEVGTPNIKQIAKLVNKSEQEVIADLGSQVFTNPETGAVEMAEIYLSGNVVEKLATAEAMAAKDNIYQKNVDALKDVQPKFIAPNDISSNLGSGWIPGEVIKQFSQEVLDANITANYSGAAGIWDVSGYSRNSDYQTPSKTTKELMDAILNSKPITVSYTVDGKSYTDAEKTELAEQMASKIQKAFKDWIWKDTERANTLAEYYNKNYNNIVPPTFNGDHLTLAGMSSKIKLRPHQKTGIYRVISQGDVYLNHAVGAGKTFTMIAAAMEEKRLGLINKPMFVVPNHMLAQFSQEFLMLYPAANIVVADEQNFHTHNRKQFVAEISVNNPDAIIITHTAFGKIGVKPETQKKFLENTLNDWREALLTAKSVKGEDNSQSVRQLERNIQTMETKLTDLLKAEAKDDTTFFEDMGVDKLIVDEMHEYRKLSYATRQGRIKGIVSSGSQMASDLQMKIELIREKNPTRAIVGASGTPVTNTMGELFSVQTYFQPKQLRKDGLHHFDNWSNQFGEVVKGLEQNAAGNYEVVPRFAKFLNVPELMSRVRWFMDVLTSDQLGDVVQRPDIVGGGRQIISVPAPDGFDAFQQGLADRITATRNRSGKPKKGDDNILKIINDGRFGAIDLRFNNPDLPSDPNSKLNRAIADMAQAYHDTANNEYHDGKGNVDELTGGAQMLFTNIGLGAQSAASTGFDMKAWINSELIRLGVEPDHIAFMADANSHAKKGKLFEDMRQGRKRILIGGSNMETGVNAQKRLTHLAHLDSPWYPATVEQREGRIIRQGNQNKEVVIRAYATKGSYDSTMWGMVARKARFIQQAMSGDISMRHMDDISEASAFEQASALSSGDPRALQLAGLAADVERLDRYYSAYENARIENSREAKRSRESAVRAERELGEVNKLLETHKDIETGGVIGKVGSKTFDNRQEFGEAIVKAFDKLKATQAQGEHVLGTASGYNVVYNGVMLGETFIADADISIPKSNDNVLFDNNSGEVSASGVATSIINRVNGLADYKSAIQKKIEGFKKDADNFERRASQSFENEVERKEKHAAYKELDDTLRAEAAAIKAQASGSNSARPLTDADRVPNSDSNRPTLDDMPKYSKTNPAKGNTGTTSQQVISALQKHFGKDAVAALIKSGKLRVRSLNDFVNADGRLLIPSDAEGFYYDGKVVLIADNLTADNAVATLLHEMGGHAGIQSMLDPQTYMGLMANFDALVKSGNKYAVRAKERAEASTDSDSEARDEYIPYLITEYAQASERGGAIGVIKRFVNRVMAGVRAWVRNHTGVQLKMTPNDMVQLAERMVKRLSEQSATDMTIADVENMPAAEMQFSGSNIPSQQVAAIRKQYKGSASWMKAPNGEPTKLSEKQWLQVRTPHFKDWFGDWEDNAANASKVVDTNGEPLVMYHGTNQDFWAFDMDRSIKGRNNGMRGMFFSDNAELAASYSVDTMNNPDIVEARRSGDRAYVDSVKARLLTEATTNADANTKAVFINSRTPLEQDMKGGSFWEANQNAAARMEINQDKWDGVINDNVEDNASNESAHGPTKVVISFDPTNIKSATDNVGMFNASNADIRYSNKPQFSRRYSNLGTDGKPVTAKEKALDKIALAQATTMSSKFGINLLLRRHLATPQHVALLNPVFKLFTDNIQSRIAYENNEAGLVQTLLPEIWDTRLVVGKKKAAMERVSTAIFDGTMADQVWTDSELETKFNHTRQDIGFYRRARRAIDKSVMNMTVDTLSSLAKGTKLVNMETIQRLKLAGMHPIFHNLALQQHMTDELQKLAKGGLITPKAEARMQKQLDAVFDVMGAVAGKYDKLVEDGYAPLMRFGHYAVEVRDKVSNDLDLFELYETKGQQRKAIKELKERYDESQFSVGTGTLNPEGFKQFKNKGLSPETVQLFAAELGLDDDSGYQAYLKIAVSDRSALKRLIHRKKVPGYSEDMPRVLSSFVMSNARYSGRGLYNSEIERSIQNIEDGNLQNEAQKVFENIENPQEEFAQQRSLMFHYFMGFSPAFFFLNLTQPFTQTIPKLTAYVGAGKGHAYMAQALGIVGKNMGASAIEMGKKVAGMPTPNWRGFEDKLPAWVKKEDYLRMAREGHLDPQNIYMIKGLERGKGGVASGIWGNIESAAGWFAEVSESMNRRSTMIAAFRVAHDMGDAKLKAKGFDSKYDFAVSIIQQTQGIYNKGNRSGLARGNGKLGQYGPLILVFKQFTINYTEQMIRHGKDKEAKSLAVAMMWQFALAGMLGLPFADDLRDLFEGIAYRVFGKAFNLPDYLEGLLGKSNADALMYGLASEKGRIDLFGRSSLGNVIPGTDVIRPGPTDWAEILGASSGFYESFFSAASMAADGKYKDALITASPRYIRDAASGAEIALTGSYRNTKGDKIMDLDKTDAVIKSMAFNPSNNARPGRDRSNYYDMKNMLNTKFDYFSKSLAEATYQENDDRVDALYNEIDEWNDKNTYYYGIDLEKLEKSVDKRIEKKDFGSAERQNLPDGLEERKEELAGT